jgi:glycosyltransferase involved in cell wall biosynthesis
VLSSISESCSMALLEAIGWGLPVIATGVGGTTELVDDGSNGLLVPSDDAEALAAAIRRLTHDAALRRRFSAANRLLVRENFSWRSVAASYQEIFREAVERPHAEGGREGNGAVRDLAGSRHPLTR